MNALLFLAAVACFAIAIIVVCVPVTGIGPALAWIAGGMLAWLLLDHMSAGWVIPRNRVG